MNVGAHCHAGLGNELDAVLGHSSHRGCVDYLRIHTGLDRLKHIATCQVNGRGLFEAEVNVGLRGRHQSVYYALHVAACHVVGLQIVARDGAQAGLVCLDERRDNHPGRHIADAHQEQLYQRNLYARHLGREPQEEGHEMKEHRKKDNGGKYQAYHYNRSFKHVACVFWGLFIRVVSFYVVPLAVFLLRCTVWFGK